MQPTRTPDSPSTAPANPFAGARFLLSAARLSQLPPDGGAEVAFAGRSNAGKSSALNALAGRRRLAHTGKLPGRTRALNFFELHGGGRLVDLPGYGFARVPAEVQRAWARLIEGYLGRRRSLAGLVLLMDARRPLEPGDRELLRWCAARPVPVLPVLTKADKLGRAALRAALEATRAGREADGSALAPLAISATRGTGIEALREHVGVWLRRSATGTVPEGEPAGAPGGAGNAQKKAPACCSGGGRETAGASGRPGRGSRAKSRSGRRSGERGPSGSGTGRPAR